MCNHEPIVIHDQGGQSVICRYCKAVLQPWRRSGEAGQCGIYCFISFGCSAFFAVLTWLVIHQYSVKWANIAGIAALVVGFCVCMFCLGACRVGDRIGDAANNPD